MCVCVCKARVVVVGFSHESKFKKTITVQVIKVNLWDPECL